MLHSFWPKLEKLGIIRATRNIGRAKLYKLDLKNPMVGEIIKFDEKLCALCAGKAMQKSLVVAKSVKNS